MARRPLNPGGKGEAHKVEVKVEEGFKAIDKCCEEISKRLEDINSQLDRISAIFTALVIAVIAFEHTSSLVSSPRILSCLPFQVAQMEDYKN